MVVYNRYHINSLKNGQLINLVWRGGNGGLYYVYIPGGSFKRYAVSDHIFENDGTIKDLDSFRAFKTYNPMHEFDVESFTLVGKPLDKFPIYPY